MKTGKLVVLSLCALALVGLALSPVLAQEKAKAKLTKIAGDVGNVNEEKNTITIVTRDAKIITINIPQKAKLQIAKPGKLADTPLGAAIEANVDEKGDAANVLVVPRGGEE
ncbi:MAG: hypothetical protein HYY65_04525 [Candidatus Tectomicrobia bacterium]|uniref:DUF5666 domain-containing protein n=1 Tax=Tectimicrobiota bacterium TaxID=2528274 RepID=A0A932GND1_UNCTE|nr:hypothetical protein [Candidatus Tectomicrobia bacterium]